MSARFLVIGMVGAVVLAVLTVALPLLEVNRLRGTTLEIAERSQQATYYLGEVGHQLARLRFHSLQPGSWQELADIEQRLQIAFDRLPASLDAQVYWHWAAVGPDALRLRQIYRDATNLVRADQVPRAAALLAAEAATTTRVHDSLDRLAGVNRASVLTRLQATHREASRIGGIGLVLLGVFFAGLIAIFTIMIRIVYRQRGRLAEYTARLETTNADLDAFAGRVAHDLKNALGPIVMAPDMLRQSPGDTAAVLRIAERIERSSRRTVGVVDALLAFARAGRTVDPDQASTPPSVVESVLEELAPQIAKHDVRVDVAELPIAEVRCSSGLLHIVLANLCGNAIKFLGGQSERRMQIHARIAGPAYEIIIEDTGPGIPEDALDKIFEPFFRAPGVQGPGSGIGLATVRRIVDACGGRVTVESELGRGSRFRLSLPLAPASPSPPDPLR